MRGNDRRPRWKQSVYAPRDGMTDGCRVLLLRLLDSMDYKGIVSVPRSKLAADLGVAPARVSERIKLARSLGFLDQVRRPRPKVTAVYQGTIPDFARGTTPVPHEDSSEVQPPVSIKGTDAVPLNGGSEVRMYPTQVVGTGESESQTVSGGPVCNEERTYEQTTPHATHHAEGASDDEADNPFHPSKRAVNM